MKKLLILLNCLFFAILSQAQDASEECASSKILALKKYQQNARLMATMAGDNNIDVTYYKLDLGITYSSRNIKGEVAI